MWFHFLSYLLPVSYWFGNPTPTSPLKRSSTLFAQFEDAHCKYSSNSNQGKVSSHFLLYFLIPDPDLEGGLEVELETCFLGGLGCTSIADSLPSSQLLELYVLKTWMHSWNMKEYKFLGFVSRCLIYHSIWCMCLVLFPSKNRSHGLPFYNRCVNC